MNKIYTNKNVLSFEKNLSHTLIYKLDHLNNLTSSNEALVDKWNNEYVRMPCSPLSLYPVEKDGKKSLLQRWILIKDGLKSVPRDIYDIKKIILGYNSRFENEWDFDVLIQLFENELSTMECDHFFSIIYPGMVELAINLPDLIKEPIPLLRAGVSHGISLTQLQIASLLSNAFFCTFPRRNSRSFNSEFKNYPDINFSSLFSMNKNCNINRKVEKLKCILNYFNRVITERPDGVVTYTRRCLNENLAWENKEEKFNSVSLDVDNGSIFSSLTNSIKIDFANEYPGGSVLGNGCVQEEILFITHPELIVSCLFTEKLHDHETLLVQGVQLYSLHTGYSDTFKYKKGSQESTIDRDSFGRLKTVISVMDATFFHGNSMQQFKSLSIERELKKAYCGFYDWLPWHDTLPNLISTGNWGCGSFGGDYQLKFIIQIMVCAHIGKNMIYYTFDDIERKEEIVCMFQSLKDSNCSIGQLWCLLQDYFPTNVTMPLFDYLRQSLM